MRLFYSFRLFSVFWTISTLRWSEWSRFFFGFSTVPIFWKVFQVHQLQLVLPSPACSIFLVLLQGPSIQIIFLLFFFTLWSAGMSTSTRQKILFLFFISTKSGLQAGIRWSVVSKNHREFYTSCFLGGILVDVFDCMIKFKSFIQFLHS